MERIVIDTNVLISSAITSGGNPEKIMNLVSDRQLMLYYSRKIINEYERVLAYEKFGIKDLTQAKIINSIKFLGILIEPEVSNIPFSDESDKTFYDTAKTSASTLVTGNIKHFPDEPFIMTPADFIIRINNSSIYL